MFRRSNITPRADWQAKVTVAGVPFHTNVDGSPYWDERVCFRFTEDEAVAIKLATAELHSLIIQGVAHVFEHPELITERFGIPEAYVDYLITSFRRQDPHLLGRFDLAFDPATKAVKMIEFNGDTPVLLVEALAQREWKIEFIPTARQFNTVHDKLLTAFQRMEPLYRGSTLHFTSVGGSPYDEADSRPWAAEEFCNCTYLMERARSAGINTKWIDIFDVGYNAVEGFTDLEDRPIEHLVKMYPWDWIAIDDFGSHMLEDRTHVIEPVWSMIASNKALLPILWEMFPNHPNLLPCYFGDSQDLALNETGNYFIKPITGRWGENVVQVKDHEVLAETDGHYDDKTLIYQGAAVLPSFNGSTVVIGSFTVRGLPAGMVVKESDSAIQTNENCRIIPHYIAQEIGG